MGILDLAPSTPQPYLRPPMHKLSIAVRPHVLCNSRIRQRARGFDLMAKAQATLSTVTVQGR